MALSSLWKLAVESPSAVSVVADLCKRRRYPRSDCQRCRDLCPESAISLHPEPRVGVDCSGCGLCVTACPMEAFRPLLRSDTDLLREVALIAEGRRSQGSAGAPRLNIRCERGEAQGEDELVVPCLGSLSENVLVGAALEGLEELVLVSGSCAECRLRSGSSLIPGLLEDTRSLLDGLALDTITLTVEQRPRSRRATLSRKDLLRRARRRFRRRRLSAGSQDSSLRPRPHGAENAVSISATVAANAPRRALLGSLVGGLAWAEPETVEAGHAGRWSRLAIDEARCSACGTCGVVCPTAALSMTTEDSRARLRFEAVGCTNCDLCIEACAEGAISRLGEWSVTDLARQGPCVLAEVPLRACAGCGASIGPSEAKLCPTCERRGIQPY